MGLVLCTLCAITHSPEGWVMHIYVSKLTVIISDNGLLPDWCQAIIRSSAGILLIGPFGTNFNEILIKIQQFSFKKMCLKKLSAKFLPFCPSLNVLSCTFKMHCCKSSWQWVILGHLTIFDLCMLGVEGTWALSQYKDRLIYVWRFPC